MPFFFRFLLLEMSWSLAGAEASAFVVAEVSACPCWISFTWVGGGGSDGSGPLSVGFSSLGSGVFGFSSFGSGAAGWALEGWPKGDAVGVASEGGADAPGTG